MFCFVFWLYLFFIFYSLPPCAGGHYILKRVVVVEVVVVVVVVVVVDQPYSLTMSWLRCRITLSMLRSAIRCLRGHVRVLAIHTSQAPKLI